MTPETDAAIQEALNVTSLVERFGRVNRATFHVDGTPESDTTHTVMLMMVVYQLFDAQFPDEPMKNFAGTLLLALHHDLPEAYAGDVSTFAPLDAEARAAKDKAEAAGLDRMVREHPKAGEFASIYEETESYIKGFVCILDKALPKMMHAMSGIRPAAGRDLPVEKLRARHLAQGADLRVRWPELEVAHEFFDRACALCEEEWVKPVPSRARERRVWLEDLLGLDDTPTPDTPLVEASDLLDDLIEEGDRRSPGFARLVDDAYRRRISQAPPPAEDGSGASVRVDDLWNEDGSGGDL